MKYIPWTRSDTSGRAASRCLSRLEVFWPLRTFEDAVDLNLWLSVSFFDLFSSVASLHLETVLETLVPLPSVQASVAALLGVLLQADDQLEVVGGVAVLDVGATTHLRLGQHKFRACLVLQCSHLK